MLKNHFESLWKKAEKLNISKYKIGVALFGKKYRRIYTQGVVSEFMKKRYQEIDEVINELAQERVKK